MPQFEFSEEGSHKFWAIELEGSSFTARWGKIGTKGQSKRQEFATPAEAKREYEKLIASKVKKGYQPVGAAEPGRPTAGGAEVDLEAAILQNPNDPQAYLVYADWLQSQGDPRGELISIQHARLTSDDPKLAEREAQLLSGQNATFFGDLAPLLEKEGGLSVIWHLGFLKRVRLGRDTYDSELDVGAALRQILDLSIGRCIEELTIGLCGEPGDGDFQPAIDALVESRKPQTLRKLLLGDFDGDQSDMSATQVGDLSKFYRVFSGLQSLTLRGGSATLGKIQLPELREFTFETGGLSVESLEAIAAAQWPKLEKLNVWFGDENYGSEAQFDDLEPILRGKGLGALRHLGLMNSAFLTGNVEALAKARVLAQLQTLDLSRGLLADEDAEAFVRHARAFQHLERLDVSSSYLSDRGLFLLRKVVKTVVADHQNTSGLEDDRYVSVGE